MQVLAAVDKHSIVLILFQLGVIVSYVLGPLVVLKSEEITDGGTNWSYYLMGQTLLAFSVFIITVAGKCIVKALSLVSP